MFSSTKHLGRLLLAILSLVVALAGSTAGPPLRGPDAAAARAGVAIPELFEPIPSTVPADALASGEVWLTILHTNDTHAHCESFKRKSDLPLVGGFARLATEVKRARAENPNSLLVSAGDVFQGTLYYNFFKGRADVECMNAIGYDLLSLGNHEFDDTQESLFAAISMARFPILNANLTFERHEGLRKLVVPTVTRTVAGVKIGMVGLVTRDLFTLTHPRNTSGIKIREPIDVATEWSKKIRGDVDLLFFVNHVGLRDDLELAALVPGIDVIVGGHSHTALRKPVIVRNPEGKQTVVVQAGEWVEHLGRLDLAWNPETRSMRVLAGQLIPITESTPEDAAVAGIVGSYTARIGKDVEQVLGSTEVPLEFDKSTTRLQETNLGNLAADALREVMSADLALINGGGIRKGIPGPGITIKDAIETFPFDNEVVRVRLKGKVIRDAFDLVIKKLADGPFGGFLQVSGGKVLFEKGKVKEIEVGGTPLDPDRLYTVAMSEFTAQGGDGFSMFAGSADLFTAGMRVSDVFMDYIRRHSPLNPRVEGRIVFK